MPHRRISFGVLTSSSSSRNLDCLCSSFSLASSSNLSGDSCSCPYRKYRGLMTSCRTSKAEKSLKRVQRPRTPALNGSYFSSSSQPTTLCGSWFATSQWFWRWLTAILPSPCCHFPSPTLLMQHWQPWCQSVQPCPFALWPLATPTLLI